MCYALFLLYILEVWVARQHVRLHRHPVCAERNVGTMKSQSASDVKVASVNAFAKLREHLDHVLYHVDSVVNRIVKVLHAVLLT